MPNDDKQRLDLFLDRLGSASGAPGGGAGAALCAATGAALLEMVMRINKEKKDVPFVVAVRRRLQKLMALDAQAFAAISALVKGSKHTAAFQTALKNGAKYPQEMCRLVSELSVYAARQKNKTGRWLLSDLKEAAILLTAAFESAKLNVYINLNSLKNHATAAASRKKMAGYEKKLRHYCRRVLKRRK